MVWDTIILLFIEVQRQIHTYIHICQTTNRKLICWKLILRKSRALNGVAGEQVTSHVHGA